MKRKILAILTTACLVLTMFPVAAFAGTTPIWSGENWGDNCLSDSWYVANKMNGYNTWKEYQSAGEPLYNLAETGNSDNWIFYEIKSTRYDNPGFWVSVNDTQALAAEVGGLLTESDLTGLDESLDCALAKFSYNNGAYFGLGVHLWKHCCLDGVCSYEAKVCTGTQDIYYHDIDNALKFVYDYSNPVTLYPYEDAKIDGKVLLSSALIEGFATSDTWTLNKNVVIDLSEAGSDAWTLDRNIVVPADKTLTVKGGELDLKGNHFDVQGSLVIDEGAVVEAGAPSDSWAIETSGQNAKVVIDGQLNANANGIKAEKGANVTIGAKGVLDAKRDGIEATKPVKVKKVPTITVNGEIKAGGYGITAEGYKIDVIGNIEAEGNGIDAKDCIVKIAGAAGTPGGSDSWATIESTNTGTSSDSWCGVKLSGKSNLYMETYSKIKGYTGLEILASSVANLNGGEVEGISAAILQKEAGTELNITRGTIKGQTNAIKVEGGTFDINATDITQVKSETGIAIVLKNNGKVVPSIKAGSDNWLVVEGGGGKDAVSVEAGSWFWGGFISAYGAYSSDVNDKYIKQGSQDVSVGGSSTWVKVVPCQTITGKNVSLSTSVVNFVNGDTPKPEVTVKIGGNIVDPMNYELQYENDQSVGKAKVTVKATGDNYKGTVVKYYYVKGPVTPGTVLDPGQKGDYTVKVIGNHFVYNGYPIKPLVSVYFGSLPVNPLDYTVTYGANVNAGKDAGKVFVESKAVVANGTEESKAKFTGKAEFTIEKRDLYVIPNSYTKKKTAGSDTWKIESKAYGYVPKDIDDVSGFVKNLLYEILGKDGKTITGAVDNAGKVDMSKLGLGVYQIAISDAYANVENNIMNNYNVTFSEGKLIVLDANGKAPVVDFKTTGNSLVDMINNAIKTATKKIAVEIKGDVDVPIISQLEKAVEKAQELWKKLVPNKVY